MKIFYKFILILIPCLILCQENTYNNILTELKNRNYLEAIKICETKIKETPTDASLYAYLSFVYYSAAERRTVEIDQEMMRYRGIKRGDSYNFKENESMQDFLKEKITFNKDTLKLSELAMLKALSLDKNNFEFLLSLCEIYFAQKNHTQLLGTINNILSMRLPVYAPIAINKFGNSYFNKQEYDKALDIYKKIYSHFQTIDSYTNAAACHITIGQISEAIQLLQTALQINPLDSISLEYLYQANVFQLKNDVATYYKEILLEQDSLNINHNLDIAFAYLSYDEESSIYYFEKYLSLYKENEYQQHFIQLIKDILDDLQTGKNDPLVNLMRSEDLNSLGYINYAIFLLSQIIQKDNTNSPAYFDLAMIFRDLNHFKTAINYFSVCEELTKELSDIREILNIVYYEKAKTYFLMKDYKNVIKYVKLNVEKFGRDSSELRYILGMAYLEDANKESAKKEFNNAIRLNDNEKFVGQSKVELAQLNQ
jgi:tetratricopeptide (TPR) repeat protein